MISFLLLTFALVISSCNRRISIEEARGYYWKYNEGFHIGDYLVFEGELMNAKISNDTIFIGAQPKGLVKQCYADEAIITSLDKNDEGVYSFKGPIKKN